MPPENIFLAEMALRELPNSSSVKHSLKEFIKGWEIC